MFGVFDFLGFVLFIFFALVVNIFLVLSFNTGFSIENITGEDVWVIPYAVVDGSGGEHVPLHKEYFIKKDESVRVDFNWDDLSLRYFEVRNNAGKSCRLIASKYYGIPNQCCSDPEQEVYFVQPLNDSECDPLNPKYAKNMSNSARTFTKTNKLNYRLQYFGG